MTFEEFKKYYEENKETQEVKTLINTVNKIDVNSVKQLVNEDKELRSWLDSEKDKHFNISFETWKSNNLQKAVDDEVRKRYPQKTESEIEIEKLRLELEKMKKETTKKELTNIALKEITSKNLPQEIVDFLISEDVETTINNVAKFENVFDTYKQSVIKDFDKNSYKAKTNANTTNVVNPWAKETFNLTEQARILRESPELALRLKNL